MIKTDLNNYDNVFLKNESDLERIMSNRSLLLQQRPGTKNFLVLGKYERALDKLSVSIQLIDISSWEEVGLKKIRGDYNDVSSTNKSTTEMVSTLLKPYLPKPNESIYPALTDGKRMRTPPTYAERAMDVSSSIDAAIEELEKRMDVNMGVRGEENEFESKEIEGEWILNIEEESYENDRPENEFNTNSNLAYVLLVGDHAYVPSSSTSAGDSDNNYAYIVGGDHYPDLFMGRFSAETEDEAKTMIYRTIYTC